ncbi:MAG: flagellar motor switch protein FliN [Desulfobacterales bacterium]
MKNKPENTSTAEVEKSVFGDHPPEKGDPSPEDSATAGDTVDGKDQTAAPMTAEPQRPREVTTEEQPVETDHRDAPRLGDESNLDVILGIPLAITVELGRVKMTIHELLQLGPGSAVALSRLEGEPVDILANNKLIARGVVLVKDEKYGIRITETTGGLERLRDLR